VDAIKLLIEDHQEARKTMEAIDGASGPAKKALFAVLTRGLKIHDRIEENIFYPAVRGNLETAGYTPADRESHLSVEKSILRLKALSVDDPHWSSSFDLMRSHLLRHIADEETHLFLKIRDFFDPAKLEELGKRMKAEKDRLLAPA
jgi:hypothetical protein